MPRHLFGCRNALYTRRCAFSDVYHILAMLSIAFRRNNNFHSGQQRTLYAFVCVVTPVNPNEFSSKTVYKSNSLYVIRYGACSNRYSERISFASVCWCRAFIMRYILVADHSASDVRVSYMNASIISHDISDEVWKLFATLQPRRNAALRVFHSESICICLP